MKIQSATYLGICIAALGCSGKPSTQGQPEQGQTEQAPEQTGARKSPSPGNADDAPAKNQPAAAPSPDGASAPPPPGALGRLDHPDAVTTVMFSPDGSRIATVCEDNNVRLWNARSFELEGVFPANTSGVALDETGATLVAADTLENKVFVWDTKTRTLRHEIHGQGLLMPHGVAIARDGGWFAATSQAALFVWDRAGERTHHIELPMPVVSMYQLGVDSSDSYLIAPWYGHDRDSLGMTHPRAGTAMFEVETGKYEVKSLIEDKVNVSSMAVSPDLERLAAHVGQGRGGSRRTGGMKLTELGPEEVQVLDRSSRQLVASLPIHAPLAFSPTGSHLLVTVPRQLGSERHKQSKDFARALLFDVATRKVVHEYEGHSGHIRSAAFSADGRTLATASEDRSVLIWSAPPGISGQAVKKSR